MRTRPTALLVIPILALVLPLVGCQSAPGPASGASSSVWSRSGPAMPGPGATVAVTQHDVEFVTSKQKLGENSQAAFLPPHPGLLIISAAGAGRKTVELPDERHRQIARAVAVAVEAELEAAGWALLDASRVAGASAYSAYGALPPGEIHDISVTTLITSDTGRIGKMRLTPGTSLGVVPEDQSDDRTAALAMMDELGVDAVAQVVLRVGVFRGHASVEQGSRIHLHTRRATTSLAASRSILSERTVTVDGSESDDQPIDPALYETELARTAAAYVRLALGG